MDAMDNDDLQTDSGPANNIDVHTRSNYISGDLEVDCAPCTFKNDTGQVDLEVDCAPHIARPVCTFAKPNAKELMQKDRYDSGYQSFKSQETESLNKCMQEMQLHDISPAPRFCEEPQQKNTYGNRTQLDIVFEQDSEGDSQLHLAIIQLLTPLALYFVSLVPHYNFLNQANDLQQTPLHLAVLTGLKSVVRRLIVGGADVTCRDHRGDTPLHIACRNGDDESVALLLDPVRYDETLDNNYKIPYQKIPQNLELRNYNGQCCIHLAADGSHIEVIKLLLRKGANLNTMDGKSGRTVLHYAAESGDHKLVDFLLSIYKIKVDARTYSGQTPLLLARGRGHQDVVLKLMQRGAKFEYLPEDSDSDEDMDDSVTL